MHTRHLDRRSTDASDVGDISSYQPVPRLDSGVLGQGFRCLVRVGYVRKAVKVLATIIQEGESEEIQVN